MLKKGQNMGYNIDVTNNFYEEKLFGGQNWSPSLANTPKNTKNILKTMAKSSIIKKRLSTYAN